MKAPTKAPGTWTCKVCMLNNDSAKTKCAACEEPRVDSAPAPAAPGTELPKSTNNSSGGFKWAAAGVDEPRLDSVPALGGTGLLKSTNTSGGFNWAAAGLKAPTKAPGTWTCKVCMLNNDATKTKCVSCEEPRA
jgi:hypothetical protein